MGVLLSTGVGCARLASRLLQRGEDEDRYLDLAGRILGVQRLFLIGGAIPLFYNQMQTSELVAGLPLILTGSCVIANSVADSIFAQSVRERVTALARVTLHASILTASWAQGGPIPLLSAAAFFAYLSHREHVRVPAEQEDHFAEGGDRFSSIVI